MRSKLPVPDDVVTHAKAVSDAIAAEDLQHAKQLLTTCTQAFAARQRSAAEVHDYVLWLRQQQAAVRQCREHLALRLSAVNVPQYGRTVSEVSWSLNA